MADRRVFVDLIARITGYKTPVDEATKSTEKLGDKAKKTKTDLEKLGTGMVVVGAGLAAAFGAATMAAAKFDKQMSEVGAVADASTAQMSDLRQAALDAGAATVFSASEAAQAEAELAKAGIKTADILGGALRGSLDLAAAGSVDLATAAEIAAAAMNTFHLRGKDVGHIADVLAAGANKSAAGIEDLGQGLQQVGLVADQAGLSLEETVGLLAAFADRGLKGSDGATSLKTAIQRLVAPIGDAKKLMDQLGISVYDANGNVRGAADLAGQLQTALSSLSDEQRNAAMNTIFGSDAIRAANVLYSIGAKGVQEYVDAVNDQGAASEVANKKLDNLAGSVEQLKGSLETLFIKTGEGAQGPLRQLVDGATRLVNDFGSLPGPVQSTALALTAVSGGALLAGGAYLKLRGKLADYVEQLALAGPRQAAFGRGLQSMVGFAGKAAVALAGLQIAGSIASSFMSDLNPQIEAGAKGLAEWDGKAKLAGEAARIFGDDADGLSGALKVVHQKGFLGGVNAVDNWAAHMLNMTGDLDKAKEKVGAFDQMLVSMVQAGHPEAAAAAIEEMAKRTGGSVEEVRSMLTGYNAAVETSTGATGDAAKAEVDLNKALGIQADALKPLNELWDQYHGKMLGVDEAQLSVLDAIDAVTKSFKENGKSIAGNSRAAVENRIALEEAAKKAADLAQAYLDQTGDVDGAAKKMAEYRDAAIKATGTTGDARKAVEDLAGQLFNLPTSVVVDVKLRISVSNAISAAIQAALSKLGSAPWFSKAEGGILQHAASGLLREAGIATKPLVSWAEPSTGGEAFVPKNGDRGRALSILQTAAGWHDAAVVPMRQGVSGGGRGGGVIVNVIPPSGGNELVSAFMNAVRVEVRDSFGNNVQAGLSRRGRRS